jgi:quercetin 2,3-dioxygenase
MIKQIISAQATSDGAGVKLYRSIGAGVRLDPFLMLDEFGSDNAADYVAGFPPHPHRGFETITYMLDGHMRHEDHLGNVGELKSGGVQWMSAGRGIIHSEMPQQEHGRMRGFQLWLNLPASEKMHAPTYRDIPASEIPEHYLANGVRAKIIAGAIMLNEQHCVGAVNSEQKMTTDPLYLDLHIPAGASMTMPLPADRTIAIYVYEGALAVADQVLHIRQLAVLDDARSFVICAQKEPAKCIVLAGKPLREPVVQHGPFVMNTREEIEQALRDYRDGTLAQVAQKS